MNWLKTISWTFFALYYTALTAALLYIGFGFFMGGLVAIVFAGLSIVLGVFPTLYLVYLHAAARFERLLQPKRAASKKKVALVMGICTIAHWMIIGYLVSNEIGRSHHWAFG